MKAFLHIFSLVFTNQLLRVQSDHITHQVSSCTIKMLNQKNIIKGEIYQLSDSFVVVRQTVGSEKHKGNERHNFITIPVVSIKNISTKSINKLHTMNSSIKGGIVGMILGLLTIPLNAFREAGILSLPNDNGVIMLASIGFLLGGLLSIKNQKADFIIDGCMGKYISNKKEILQFALIKQ